MFLRERVAGGFGVGSQRHCGEILLLYLASGHKELFLQGLLLEVSHSCRKRGMCRRAGGAKLLSFQVSGAGPQHGGFFLL